MKSWIYIWDSLCSDDVKIDGISIYDPHWKRIRDEEAKVVDPIYGETHTYPVFAYKKKDGTVLRVAMTEHTPGVYLAFVDDPELVGKVFPKSKTESETYVNDGKRRSPKKYMQRTSLRAAVDVNVTKQIKMH